MRFMAIMYPGPNAEAGVTPDLDSKLFEDMGRFNEELVKAGVMLAGEGLHPSSKGARIRFAGGKGQVSDGPFTETKEIVGGFLVRFLERWRWTIFLKIRSLPVVRQVPFW